MQPPLAGIRVLDLSWNIAGPAATAILADLGAEVWKVERPDQGDDARRMAPLLQSQGAYFWAINRNKRSIGIDLGKPEGRALVLRLAAQCDVCVENFRAGKAAALGLGPDDLRRVRPDLIYCSLSAYGDRGPEREKSGYDAVLQARTGIMSITGPEQGPPVRAGVSILDLGSAMWAALGVVTALLARRESGQGTTISTSLFETGAFWMVYHLMYHQATGQDPEPQGARHIAFAPYGSFQAADGLIVIGVSSDGLFQRCCRALAVPELAADPRLAGNIGRVQHRADLEAALNAAIARRPVAHWLERLDAEGVPAAPLQKVSQLLQDPQFAACDLLQSVPGAGPESPRVPRLPLRFDGGAPAVQTAAPALGGGAGAVLAAAGLTSPEIAALRAAGVLGPEEG